MNDRRKLLKTAVVGAGLYGVAPFYGPWKTNRAWAQNAQKKPLVIGLTMDSSGQYAASGADSAAQMSRFSPCRRAPSATAIVPATGRTRPSSDTSPQ